MHDDFEVVKSFIRGNALKMLKEGNGVFKHPFIDPGAGYENNLWDWIPIGAPALCSDIANISKSIGISIINTPKSAWFVTRRAIS